MVFVGHQTVELSLFSRRVLVVFCLAAFAWSAGAVDAGAQPRRARLSEDLARKIQRGDHTDTNVIFTGTQAEVDALAARHGLTIRKRLRSGAVLGVAPGRLAGVAEDPAVQQLSGNHAVFTQMDVTNRTIGADQVQAGLAAAGVPGLTGKGIGVAVIDSGIAPVPELRGRIVASRDFTDDRGRGRDEHGHGTHVAGIIAASGVNARDDTRGVAPEAHLISLKVLDARGRGTVGDVIQAIDWAIEHRARFNIRVINLSLGGPVLQSWRLDPLCQAVERAYRAGIVVVTAAGNRGVDDDGELIYGGITVPGNSPFALTVAAVNTNGTPSRRDDRVALFSSRGLTRFDLVLKPDIAAPGSGILGLLAPGTTLAREYAEHSVSPNGAKRIRLSGTSMASPVVAGAIADILGKHRKLTPVALRVLLQYSAEQMRDGLLSAGAGSLNLVAAAVFAQIGGAHAQTTISGEPVASGGTVFLSSSLLAQDDANILWGTEDGNILWGTEDGNILWGTEDGNILWGTEDGNILWGTEDGNILWGTEDGNILWGTEDGNILWGTSH